MTIFPGISGNPIFVNLQNHDIPEGKLLKQGELFVCNFFPLDLLIWFLRRGNFWFWVPNIGKIHFTRIWHLRYRIFWGFLESQNQAKNQWKNGGPWFRILVKWILPMFGTQNPKFPRLRNRMNNSRGKKWQKINFPCFNSFPSGMSWFCKFTKMGFPEIPEKMVELHNYIKSWEMVARGWYTAHFDRTDLLNTKKIGLDGFCHLSNFSGPICEISRFFH